MPSASNANRLGSRALLERGERLVGDCQLILRADEHQLSCPPHCGVLDAVAVWLRLFNYAIQHRAPACPKARPRSQPAYEFDSRIAC